MEWLNSMNDALHYIEIIYREMLITGRRHELRVLP